MLDLVRADMTDCANPSHIRDLRAASVMCAAITWFVRNGLLDARSVPADAAMMYGDGDGAMAVETAGMILRQYGMSG